MTHQFCCDRCKKVFSCVMCDDVTEKCTQQAEYCATSVYRQKKLPDDYIRFLDCPPDNRDVPVGQFYTQSFYPSQYDSCSFSFTAADSDEGAIYAAHPWINQSGSTNVCDFCVADMLRIREICIKSHPEVVDDNYPCYCDICQVLYENMQSEQDKFSSRGTGCSVGAVEQLPSGKWIFCDLKQQSDYPFSYVSFPNLDVNLKCLKKHGRICDKCFEQFPAKYGAAVLVTAKERYPWLNQEEENQEEEKEEEEKEEKTE